MRKLLIVALVLLAVCKDKPKRATVVKPKCHAISLITDTVLLEPEPISSLCEKGNSGEVWHQYGCITYRKLTRNIYFNPIINHSKL